MPSCTFQSLTNVLSSFTRAAGAAQRVLALIDNAPDIDPTMGVELSKAEVKGALRMEGVEFHYQMRPENKVRNCLPDPLLFAGGGYSRSLLAVLLSMWFPLYGVRCCAGAEGH